MILRGVPPFCFSRDDFLSPSPDSRRHFHLRSFFGETLAKSLPLFKRLYLRLGQFHTRARLNDFPIPGPDFSLLRWSVMLSANALFWRALRFFAVSRQAKPCHFDCFRQSFWLLLPLKRVGLSFLRLGLHPSLKRWAKRGNEPSPIYGETNHDNHFRSRNLA
jgi:hypothetical protein